MPARDGTKGILIRLPKSEHALLQTILKEDGYTLQGFFRRAAKRRILQSAQALAAVEDEPGEDL